MAKKKKASQPAAASSASAPATAATPQAFGSETYCSKCGGNVNFNGCADAECPVTAKK